MVVDPKKRAEAKKRYAAKHKEQIAEYQKKYRAEHREEMRESNRKYHETYAPKKRNVGQKARNKPYMRGRHLRIKYGLSESDYSDMLKSQGGGCAICGTTDPHGRNHNRFHVDHCHATGVVRGLLCSRCNMGLGSFLDSIPLMQKAIEYLNHRGDKSCQELPAMLQMASKQSSRKSPKRTSSPNSKTQLGLFGFQSASETAEPTKMEKTA